MFGYGNGYNCCGGVEVIVYIVGCNVFVGVGGGWEVVLCFGKGYGRGIGVMDYKVFYVFFGEVKFC